MQLPSDPLDLAAAIAANKIDPLNPQMPGAVNIVDQTAVEIYVPTEIERIPAMLRELAAAWHAAGESMIHNVMTSTDTGPLAVIQMSTMGGAAGIMQSVAAPTLLALAGKLDEKLSDLADAHAAAVCAHETVDQVPAGWRCVDCGASPVPVYSDTMTPMGIAGGLAPDRPADVDDPPAGLARTAGAIAGEMVNTMMNPTDPGNWCRADVAGFSCTRPIGHEGAHVTTSAPFGVNPALVDQDGAQ